MAELPTAEPVLPVRPPPTEEPSAEDDDDVFANMTVGLLTSNPGIVLSAGSRGGREALAAVRRRLWKTFATSEEGAGVSAISQNAATGDWEFTWDRGPGDRRICRVHWPRVRETSQVTHLTPGPTVSATQTE
jgi:hypothetical protein